MDEREAFEPLRSRNAGMPTAPVLMPAPGTKRASGRRSFGLAFVIGSSLTALVAGLAAGYVAFHKPPAKTAAPAAASSPAATGSAPAITLAGSITLQSGFEFQNDASTTCVANPSMGFTDISEGVAVNIGDQTGQTLAVTQLEGGQLVSGSLNGHACRFGFSVQVPSGKTLYTVTVSHRGTQTFTANQVVAGSALLTLGG